MKCPRSWELLSSNPSPLFFKDGQFEKTFSDGSKRNLYMVFLLFECRIAMDQPICLNPEFCEYSWAEPAALAGYDLNSETKATFTSLGLLNSASH
ncbi:MAG TPA: hypothetical protein VN643_01095 [Pyrinomonadaceae bacterium]|nr:hypothetical protein [Pyrinomonadaceae bacterium]